MHELNSRGHRRGCNCPECSTLKGAMKNAPKIPTWRKVIIAGIFGSIGLLVLIFAQAIGAV